MNYLLKYNYIEMHKTLGNYLQKGPEGPIKCESNSQGERDQDSI